MDERADEATEPAGTEDLAANPWRTLSRRVVYENPWITVEEDAVVRPDGREGIYGVVRFPGIAVGIIALDEADRLVLVGQYRYPLGRYSWEIPEGGSGSDGPLDGARRELVEETGLTARRWEELIRVDLSNSVTDEGAIVYVASDLVAGEAEPEGTERLAVRWVPLDEAIAMVGDGRITDAISVVGIQALALRRLADRRGAAGDGTFPADRR